MGFKSGLQARDLLCWLLLPEHPNHWGGRGTRSGFGQFQLGEHLCSFLFTNSLVMSLLLLSSEFCSLVSNLVSLFPLLLNGPLVLNRSINERLIIKRFPEVRLVFSSDRQELVLYLDGTQHSFLSVF